MSSERNHRYEQHSHLEYEGFQITDASIEEGELIWVGYGGMEGRWLTADQIRELASTLNKVALAHEARTAQA